MIQNKSNDLQILKSKENRTEEEEERVKSEELELSSMKSLKLEFLELKGSYSDLKKDYTNLRWKYYKIVMQSWLGRIGWLFVGLLLLVYYGFKFYLQVHG
ncbi:hypothetical protein [Leptospira kmetyi]|uniref:hypothetical protein n=1 Tax=Leptospira kmetyi TaxID=408139 RepID=UPI0012EC2878|nr:hypothetical protein [Leptospira kmetyi]